MKTMYALLLFALAGCSGSIDTSRAYEKIHLGDYWYQGKGEISIYDLQMNRYNNVHPGEVVLIQVTEDFLAEKQVKSDQGRRPTSIPVIKTNLIERFSTGIYDYSTMTSCFTQASQKKKTLKITNSSQDWCGQTFSQANYRNGEYDIRTFSYFESEGDFEKEVDPELLEDELFNLIRLQPEKIPTGNVEVLPSMRIIRHLHLPVEPIESKITLKKKGALRVLTIQMTAINRTKIIHFEGQPPYHIISWREEYPSSFDHQIRTTTATLRSRRLIDYWNLNGAEHREWRDSLRVNRYDSLKVD